MPATARASFGVHNTSADVDAFAAALDKVRHWPAETPGPQKPNSFRVAMSDLRELYQEVILDHNKRPPELPRDRPGLASRRGLQTRLRATG